MKKFIKYKYLVAVALLAITATSCTDYNQDYPDPNKPLVTIESQDLTITEGETGNISLNISKAIGNPIDLKLTPIIDESTTLSDSDYTVNAAGEFTSADDGVGKVPAYDIVVPAGSTSFNIPIDAIDDLDIEGSETISFELTTTGSGMGIVDEDNNIVTLTVNNHESKDIVIQLSWDGSYLGADGEMHDFCDFDLDMEIYAGTDLSGDIVATSYSSCPESVRIAPGDLEDGTYLIALEYFGIYDVSAPAENVNIPTMLTLIQPGVQIESFDLSDLWDYDMGGLYEGLTPADQLIYTNYLLEVNGESFTVVDASGNTVFEQ